MPVCMFATYMACDLSINGWLVAGTFGSMNDIDLDVSHGIRVFDIFVILKSITLYVSRIKRTLVYFREDWLMGVGLIFVSVKSGSV